MRNKAFSLIELIISIVVIGIVALSFPLILSQTSRNIEMAVQQEAILAIKTQMGIILSYPWDGNSVIGDERAMVLDTEGDDHRFSRIAADSTLRRGHFAGEGRRSMFNDLALVPTGTADADWGKGSDDATDVDDFDNQPEILPVVVEDIDSILSLTLTPRVRYVSDAPTGGTDYTRQDVEFVFGAASTHGITNIKRISIQATNTVVGARPAVDVILSTYSSNIGEFELQKRDVGEW